MPRIIAGTARGRRLAAPAGEGTRPTADRAREALFSALESTLGNWSGVAFLDLFAGSGAIGLEAASRGASEVVVVEREARAVATLRSNVAIVGGPVTVRSEDVARFVSAPGGPFDVIFADPPYAYPSDDLRVLHATLRAGGGVAPGATVVVERSARDPQWSWPAGFEGDRSRTYGEAAFWYGRAADEVSERSEERST